MTVCPGLTNTTLIHPPEDKSQPKTLNFVPDEFFQNFLKLQPPQKSVPLQVLKKIHLILRFIFLGLKTQRLQSSQRQKKEKPAKRGLANQMDPPMWLTIQFVTPAESVQSNNSNYVSERVVFFSNIALYSNLIKKQYKRFQFCVFRKHITHSMFLC